MSDVVRVKETEYVIRIIEPEKKTVSITEEIVSVVSVKEQGPEGPQGTSFSFYNFTQTTESATWIINHDLGYKPIISTFNEGSQEIEGEVIHISNNQINVYFAIPIKGFARLI
jgi:hypothetical protein